MVWVENGRLVCHRDSMMDEDLVQGVESAALRPENERGLALGPAAPVIPHAPQRHNSIHHGTQSQLYITVVAPADAIGLLIGKVRKMCVHGFVLHFFNLCCNRIVRLFAR